MIFVDASALVAILANEPKAAVLQECLEADRIRYFSALSAWETMSALCRSHRFSPASARLRVKLFSEALDLQMVALGAAEYELAATAYETYGKGRHKAALNMGDCFAYAGARANRAKLLFIGDDFSQTDIAPALAL